ncbi:MAG TPA: LacI family DNA-binding transcriptional regulator [Ruminiclostridium sp.]
MGTMKDIAKEAGVSLGTVSNVLNGVQTVSEENRKKVLDTVKRHNYRPNSAARTLKTKISKSLGLIIPDITNPYYPELARGAEDAAKRCGYSVFLCNNDRNVEKEREYVNVLIEKNIDGIILVKPKLSCEEILEIQGKCHVVLVDMNDEVVPGCDIINVDDYAGTIKAMTVLHEFGHKRIAFISGMMESKSSKCRQEAYITFLKDHDISVNETYIKRGSYDWYSGYKCTVELLKSTKLPTAIFASNDLMAIGAMKAVRERQMDIPYDISVIGYDDIDIASLCTPQLTTIRQPKYEIGVLGVETLIKRINAGVKNENYETKTVTLDTQMIIRETVGKAKG